MTISHFKPFYSIAKVIALIAFITLSTNHLKAQSKTDKADEVFTAVEHPANFKGGMEAFYKFLTKNVKYPEEARKNNAQGKVFLTFVVEKDGSLTDIKVLRGIGNGCDDEAVRVMKASPKWNPGKQNGLVVRQQYTVPINFTLDKK